MSDLTRLLRTLYYIPVIVLASTASVGYSKLLNLSLQGDTKGFNAIMLVLTVVVFALMLADRHKQNNQRVSGILTISAIFYILFIGIMVGQETIYTTLKNGNPFTFINPWNHIQYYFILLKDVFTTPNIVTLSRPIFLTFQFFFNMTILHVFLIEAKTLWNK